MRKFPLIGAIIGIGLGAAISAGVGVASGTASTYYTGVKEASF
jgi:hypothetical protein